MPVSYSTENLTAINEFSGQECSFGMNVGNSSPKTVDRRGRIYTLPAKMTRDEVRADVFGAQCVTECSVVFGIICKHRGA